MTISIAFYLKLRAGSRSSGTVFHSGAIFFVQIHQWRGRGLALLGSSFTLFVDISSVGENIYALLWLWFIQNEWVDEWCVQVPNSRFCVDQYECPYAFAPDSTVPVLPKKKAIGSSRQLFNKFHHVDVIQSSFFLPFVFIPCTVVL